MSEKNNNQLFQCCFIDSNEKRIIKWLTIHITPIELQALFPEANGHAIIEKESKVGMITSTTILQNGKTYIVPVPMKNDSTEDSEIPELVKKIQTF